ncbi:MAG: hypothetical protein CSA62_14860 [Planctomycetota bacterium]|nr:MAG: hypothetical protein CSA62_14860 [Planctomycetota bacterium]
MGGKRRSMESRRRAGKAHNAARRAQSERRLQPGRDGRVHIPCPKCGTTYALPPSAIDKRLTCKNCKSSFTPKVAATQKRNSAQKQMKGPLVFGGILLLVVALLFAIPRGKEEAPQKPKGPVKQYLKNSSPPVRAFRDFIEAIASKDRISFWAALELAQHYNLVHRGKKRLAWIANSKAKKDAFREELITSLFEGEEGRIFRDFEFSSVEEQELPEKLGKEPFDFTIELGPRVPSAYRGFARLRAWCIKKPSGWRALKWKVLDYPQAAGEQPPAKPKAKKKKKKKRSAGAKTEEGKAKSKKAEREQVQPGPLGHLESTPPALRRKIDEWIATLMDPDVPFKKMTAARSGLIESGKPAIPRLLNKLYESKGSGAEEASSLNLIVRCLRELSGGISFGFNISMEGGHDSARYQEMRQEVVKKWYQWWSQNSDRKEFPPPGDQDQEDR